MEAMAHGVPVVSTDTGGIPELLDGGAGIMVPERNPSALADALEKLICDEVLCASIGQAGRRRIEADFAVEQTTRMLSARLSETAPLLMGCPEARAGVRG
jgi:glycosyltransferase involved in cell wall biosynthesis